MIKYKKMEGCTMGRIQRKFTEEEIRILASNPYTYQVTDTTIRFTLAFKEEFLRRYKEGFSPKQIVQDLGYRMDILGTRRVEGLRDHIVKESRSEAGLHEGTLHNKIKPVSRDYTTLPESKAIEYMQHELLYLRQKVEFLKKLLRRTTQENGRSNHGNAKCQI